MFHNYTDLCWPIPFMKFTFLKKIASAKWKYCGYKREAGTIIKSLIEMVL